MIAIEGNIGAGKSTLCRKLQDCLGGSEKVVVMEEEILDHWLLEAFYRDPDRYAYRLHQETIKMNKRAMEQAEIAALAGKIVIMDRCLLGVWVFINANFGHMSPEQAVNISNQYFVAFKDVPKPNLVIHLQTDVEQCLVNIKARNRRGEEKITADYLRQLDQYHGDVFKDLGTWGISMMPMQFNELTVEQLARIKACRPYLIPPPKDDDSDTDGEDSDPLAETWTLAEVKAD